MRFWFFLVSKERETAHKRRAEFEQVDYKREIESVQWGMVGRYTQKKGVTR